MRGTGFSLTELLIVLAVIALATGAAALVGAPIIAREAMRGDLYAVEGAMQRTRVEAVSRNRACTVMVNAADRRVLVVDGMGTASASDDVVVRRTTLSARSAFEAPGGGTALTIDALTGDWYGVTYAEDGTVATGTGAVALAGGERHGRVSVFAGGGTLIEFWNGTAWTATGG